MGSFHGRVRPTPVGEDESFELEIFLKYVGQQLTVLAREIAIHSIVGTA
jgi:hypothetical protein